MSVNLATTKADKEAAFTRHPRLAYSDLGPSKQPKAMGYSIRNDQVRYTEWRDWVSKEVTARERYLTEEDPAELKNQAGDPK
jgi:iduronate 2-sulfatase